MHFKRKTYISQNWLSKQPSIAFQNNFPSTFWFVDMHTQAKTLKILTTPINFYCIAMMRSLNAHHVYNGYHNLWMRSNAFLKSIKSNVATCMCRIDWQITITEKAARWAGVYVLVSSSYKRLLINILRRVFQSVYI